VGTDSALVRFSGTRIRTSEIRPAWNSNSVTITHRKKGSFTGSSTYSRDDYDARDALRSSTAKSAGIPKASATFAYDHDIKTGRTAAKVHDSLKPTNAMRESRDSTAHPVTVPIGVILDTTGSMAEVPVIIQEKLSHLMGAFLDDKASGKRYLGDGYPAILIGAVDDYDAMRGEGCLQVGQFESGLEIDDNLTNLWLTANGGGTYEESYQLALYFFARHTVHDHWEKRHRKGYLFLIGDEHAYDTVSKKQVKDIIGDSLEADIATAAIVKEAQRRYHVFFILPNMTIHYGDPSLEKYWVKLLGQQNVLKLEDPQKICELIVGAVAISEEHIGIDDIVADLGAGAFSSALVPLSKVGVASYSADALPAVAGSAGGHERL
jgi:hypothetical protein